MFNKLKQTPNAFRFMTACIRLGRLTTECTENPSIEVLRRLNNACDDYIARVEALRDLEVTIDIPQIASPLETARKVAVAALEIIEDREDRMRGVLPRDWSSETEDSRLMAGLVPATK